VLPLNTPVIGVVAAFGSAGAADSHSPASFEGWRLSPTIR
jgi:hypothetical protein